jgi:MFS transporter, Spinster family, sphingosine-1-phosphate transporter
MLLPLSWRIAALLACAASLNYADRTAISSVFPLLKADLGLNDLHLAAVGTVFLWSYAFGSPFAGLLADRFSRSRVVLVSLLAWSIVTIVTGLARNASELLFARGLLGIAECAYLPAAVALIADHHPPSTRGRATALHLMGLNAGLIAGGTLAGYLGETHGWRISLFALGSSGILLAAICAVLLKDSPRSAPVERSAIPQIDQLRRLLRQPGYLCLAAQAMLVAVGTWMFFNWMPLFFRETYGLSLALAGFSGTAVTQVAAVSGALIGGVISDKAAMRASTAGRLQVMLCCYLICTPCLLVFVTGAGIWTVSAAVVVFSFFRSIATANETPSMCDLVESGARSSAQAFMNMANTLAGGSGVFVAGYLKADWGLGGVFAGVSVLMATSAGLVFTARRFEQLKHDDTFHRPGLRHHQ